MCDANPNPAAVPASVEAQIAKFEDALIGTLQEVREKKRLLAKIDPKGQKSLASSQETDALSRIDQSLDAFVKEKKLVLTEMNRLIRWKFQKNLTCLLMRRVGTVIRSFQGASAEALCIAVEAFMERGEREDLDLLLFVGADLNGLVGERTALMRAVVRGNLEAMRILIDAGAGLEVKSGGAGPSAGNTALHVGCLCINQSPETSVEIVAFLLSQGSVIDAKNVSGLTPLMLASYKGCADLVELLLSRGANMHAKDKRENRITKNALLFGQKKIVGLLLDRGVEVNESDEKGRTLLWEALKLSSAPDLRALGLDMAEFLISRGADVNARATQKPLLHWAALLGCADGVGLLLDAGADVNTVDDAGQTALYPAVFCSSAPTTARERDSLLQQNLRIVQTLISRGIDWQTTDLFGNTALAAAEELLPNDSPIRAFLAGLSVQPQELTPDSESAGPKAS